MPGEEELDSIINEMLDAEDIYRRRARILPWNQKMEPTPETDAEDERSDTQ